MNCADDFQDRIDEWVFDSITKGNTEFEALLFDLPSVYPSMVLSSLNRLASKGLINKDVQLCFVSEILAPNSSFKNPEQSIILPISHPLDFEWRFSSTANDYLLSVCRRKTRQNDVIALLSTPSLFRTILERNHNDRCFYYIANQTGVTDCLKRHAFSGQFICCDMLLDRPPDLLASAIILDPPWYEDYINPFLWMATKICKLGGFVFVSLPAEGTRPGVRQELEKTLQWSKRIGLTLLDIHPCSLPYRSPLFERNSLKIDGINNYPSEWRRGDLFTFKYDSLTDTPRPNIIFEKEWIEIYLEKVRIFIKCSNLNSKSFYDPALISITPHDILPSVSRKDPKRGLADVWTSGNRVYKCGGTNILFKILNALNEEIAPVEFVSDYLGRHLLGNEKTLIDKASQQILQILQIESAEILTYEESYVQPEIKF